MEQVLTLLQWLIPSGGVGMLLGWLTSSRLRRARTRREEHDTYMHLYEDTKQTLEELSHENSKMRHRLGRLETMLTRAYNCRYWGSCPIRREEQTRASPRPLTSLVPWWVWLSLGLWLRHRFGDCSKGLIRAFKRIKDNIQTIIKHK